MANRDRPVHSRGSRVSLHRDGTMELTDFDGSTVWSTNTTGTMVNKAELLDTGNLVLRDQDDKILWQSFDFPTDTLLPSQLLTKNKKLISSMGNTTYTSGYFSLLFDNDNVLRLLYDGPEISSLYWPNPDKTVFQNGRTNYNSSRTAVLDEMGIFSSSDRTKLVATDMGLGIKRRLTLDYDGNLRLYSLRESSNGSWVISSQAPQQQCKVHGLCGRNGICHYTPEPKCSCPAGYNVSDPSNWNKGCKPLFNPTCCDQTQASGFVALPHTDFYGYDLDYIQSSTFESCKSLCLNNCSCEAFVYRLTGEATCYLKSDLFNGYHAPSFLGTAYLKLPRSFVTVETMDIPKGSDLICGFSKAEAKRRRTEWIYLYSFVSAIGVVEVLLFALGWWCLFRRHRMPPSMEDGYRTISSRFRKFTYAELKKATNTFKEELGRGGSGAVYKGTLDDNRVVAVKKLGDIIQGEEEFWAEVSTFARVNHINLVRMWGFCSEKTHRLLIYQYVENGSLDKHLFINAGNNKRGASFMNWARRFKIALGTAKGLAYLHHECLEWVIHCDVKPENILLDSDFEPKISDFGLAKLSQRGGPGSKFSRVRGTKGYMGPEWALNLPITAKIDVYSYGVVLLEIVKGNRLSDFVVMDGQEEVAKLKNFLAAVKTKIEHEEDSWVEDMVDPALKGQFNWNQAMTMVKIGISCVDEDRSKRPTMDAVVQALLECDDDPNIYTSNMFYDAE
uniref:Receptor-like serine/threonine-protein kinase n=1 Tax=Nelumbo nucifera TaxID=4432 RepID=A0A822Y2R1_NELNU|nr:TPA_asm: hypothetical protein HUJ06_028010 [Nelumbo nucifera]